MALRVGGWRTGDKEERERREVWFLGGELNTGREGGINSLSAATEEEKKGRRVSVARRRRHVVRDRVPIVS